MGLTRIDIVVEIHSNCRTNQGYFLHYARLEWREKMAMGMKLNHRHWLSGQCADHWVTGARRFRRITHADCKDETE